MYIIDLDLLIFSVHKCANIHFKMGIVGAGKSKYVFVLDERNEPNSHFRSDLLAKGLCVVAMPKELYVA